MATVLVMRNGMTLPIDASQLEGYLKRGWVVVTDNPPAVAPVVEPEPVTAEKPKRKNKKKVE